MLAALFAACGEDGKPENPFAPLPECQGPTIVYGKGQRTLVIASLQIASATQGFDLDKDGKIDNKLGAISSLAAESLDETFKQRHDVIIPLEFFGPTFGDSDCTKFALYLGQFNKDRDQDGTDTNWSFDKDGAKGDCNDQDPQVGPRRPEIPGNRVDDDCDGYADNPKRKEAVDGGPDQDGDGVTIAQGDCDDRRDVPLARLRHPALMARSIAAGEERCDGIDYNCDGIPDNAPACDPFADANVVLDIQKASLDAMGQPLLAFRTGIVKSNMLDAGPDLFRVSIAITKDAVLDLELSGARVRGTFRSAGELSYLDNAILGGVLQAVSLARLDMIKAQGYLTPPQSLFDAVWAGGAVGILLGLKSDPEGHLLPDMDVDRDGLETFWASDPNKSPPLVDTCRDGDGTIIRNGDTQHMNSDPMRRCVFARDAKGNYRFVDGVSAALKFSAVPARLGQMVERKP
jgi:hypothetical protein